MGKRKVCKSCSGSGSGSGSAGSASSSAGVPKRCPCKKTKKVAKKCPAGMVKCLSCKEYSPKCSVGGKRITMSNGGHRLAWTCPECGRKNSTIVSK